jgi:hypothetical protein
MAGFAALTAPAPVALAQTYTADATTLGEAAVAGALDTLQSPATGPYAAVTAAIDALPSQAARANALGQLTPRNYRLMPRLSIQAMDSADREIRGYLAQRREMALDASPGVPTSGGRTMTFMATYGLKQGKYDARGPIVLRRTSTVDQSAPASTCRPFQGSSSAHRWVSMASTPI